MNVNDAIFGRRSVREYTPQLVDQKTIRRLIDAAVQAPNAVNQLSLQRNPEKVRSFFHKPSLKYAA